MLSHAQLKAMFTAGVMQPTAPSGSSPMKASKDRDTGEAVEGVAFLQLLADMNKEKSPVLTWVPVRVDSLRWHHVTEISCGMDHYLTLNEQGVLWSFGDNSLGQLGRLAAISTAVEYDRFLNHCGVKLEKMELQVH